MEETTTVPVPYEFTTTQDWFSFNIPSWTTLFPLVTSKAPRVLEIGSWEGRSAVFLLTQLCTRGIPSSGEIVCIDHFDLFQTEAGRERYEKVRHNLDATGGKYRIMPEFSVPAVMELLKEESQKIGGNAGFDWIYVDGSHEADDTFLDGELVWRLARKGAIVIFDDYHWDREPEDSIHHPKPGVDAFLKLHAGQYEMISSPEQYQVILKKTSDMRIGFLVKSDEDQDRCQLSDALGYGINVALTIDSAYAMPASVTIRSILDHTKSRITIYIVDCGLTDDDKHKFKQTVHGEENVTLVFLGLPRAGLANEYGVVWAKIDMLGILPVERVLYLDADVLILDDIRHLWDADLAGIEIGAARDIGFPNGHDGIDKGPYFNAGVLLFDLAKTRLRLADLMALSRQGGSSQFADQDALNRHFQSRWTSLGLEWNAQGLGTYANCPSPDRVGIGMESMQHPKIIHFTGPVNPRVAEVLNPYIQPFTAKPWGYAGAPGHPFEEEWWTCLAKTAWGCVRGGNKLCKLYDEAVDKAVGAGLKEFLAKISRE